MKAIINEKIASEIIKIAEDNREELEEHFCIPLKQIMLVDFDGEYVTRVGITMVRDFACRGEEE